MRVMQGYRFALDPTATQLEALNSHCGAARFAFNWALARFKAALSQRDSEISYGMAKELLTDPPWTLFDLRKAWNKAKYEVAPWWRQNSKESYNSGLDALARGLANWNDSRNGSRNGKRVAFPQFRAKRATKLSCRFTTGVIRIEPDRRHVTLPKLGTIRLHESARKLARRVEAGTGRILSATVCLRHGRWYVAFTCEVDRGRRAPRYSDAVIGVDLGVKCLAALSDGRKFHNPKHFQASLAKLRRCNKRLARRQGPRTADGGRREPSVRWRKAKAELAKAHNRVASRRRDCIHKLSSSLTRTYGVIVIEDLHVAGMLRNRGLARSIADAGFAEIRRQLGYKTKWNGGRLVVASRWFPSSKTCSACGAVKAKLALAERLFACNCCGISLDRDVNAARNLATLADIVAQSCGETLNARRGAVSPGNSAGRAPLKREPRTYKSVRGTLAPQGEAAQTNAHIRAFVR